MSSRTRGAPSAPICRRGSVDRVQLPERGRQSHLQHGSGRRRCGRKLNLSGPTRRRTLKPGPRREPKESRPTERSGCTHPHRGAVMRRIGPGPCARSPSDSDQFRLGMAQGNRRILVGRRVPPNFLGIHLETSGRFMPVPQQVEFCTFRPSEGDRPGGDYSKY